MARGLQYCKKTSVFHFHTLTLSQAISSFPTDSSNPPTAPLIWGTKAIHSHNRGRKSLFFPLSPTADTTELITSHHILAKVVVCHHFCIINSKQFGRNRKHSPFGKSQHFHEMALLGGNVKYPDQPRYR